MGLKAVVVTTITTTVDLDTFEKDVSVEVDDQSGLVEVSQDLLYATVLAGVHAAEGAVYDASPRLRRLYQEDEEENDGE